MTVRSTLSQQFNKQQNETSHLKAIGLNVDVEQHKFSQVQYSLATTPCGYHFLDDGIAWIGSLWRALETSHCIFTAALSKLTVF